MKRGRVRKDPSAKVGSPIETMRRAPGFRRLVRHQDSGWDTVSTRRLATKVLSRQMPWRAEIPEGGNRWHFITHCQSVAYDLPWAPVSRPRPRKTMGAVPSPGCPSRGGIRAGKYCSRRTVARKSFCELLRIQTFGEGAHPRQFEGGLLSPVSGFAIVTFSQHSTEFSSSYVVEA